MVDDEVDLRLLPFTKKVAMTQVLFSTIFVFCIVVEEILNLEGLVSACWLEACTRTATRLGTGLTSSA